MSQSPWEPKQDPLEQALRMAAKKIKTSGGPPKKLIIGLVIVFLVVIGGQSAFYKVDTEETGVLLRLGKSIGTAPPGLHMKLPFGIDQVYRVKTGRVLKEEFGFRTEQAGIRTTYSNRDYSEESLTLTGDLNVSDVEWIVQYQIVDPEKYLFNIADPRATIRDLSEAEVRRIIGNSNVTQVLTTERAYLAMAVEKGLQDILNSYNIGIRVVTVKFQDVNPPDQVKAAFNEVNEAEQQKESLIFQAREQYNREVPKARGVARSRILEAEGYALERINSAKGEAERFNSLVAEYRKAPKVTKQRLFLETMDKILPKVDEIYVVDDKSGGILPLLPLGKQNMNGGAK
ncbi:FtsH protease activity modulator HflK [Desulfuromonas acetoxidans]|uniref:Protein HflK n=1 Tax=Desulfuromonas acetoxidans (strain DSM 684 / 11070) TaxID=281689 RepID=Q1JXH4_DESA6|nr:FtsH protease activity modulator HflK [Desulfuromonas acetoxidans]EAT14988.1 HflK protein [Desulfuromonas acetoxidans DSM 684]